MKVYLRKPCFYTTNIVKYINKKCDVCGRELRIGSEYRIVFYNTSFPNVLCPDCFNEYTANYKWWKNIEFIEWRNVYAKV